jgi:hypothetical protein
MNYIVSFWSLACKPFEDPLEKCVEAMQDGRLDVNCVNKCGDTIGFFLLVFRPVELFEKWLNTGSVCMHKLWTAVLKYTVTTFQLSREWSEITTQFPGMWRSEDIIKLCLREWQMEHGFACHPCEVPILQHLRWSPIRKAWIAAVV